MRRIKILILMINSINIFAQDSPYTVDTIQVRSSILAENRSIVIYAPKKLSKSEKVRFIYLLDGESAGYRYQNLSMQCKDSISDLIAVGIINTDRRRDLLYALGADKFLDFITTELIPFIEKDFSTKSRILFGHSFAGSFTLYTLIKKPGTFDRYIVSSPIPIVDLINKESYSNIDCVGKIKLFLGFGSNDIRQVKKWTLMLKENLSCLELKNLNWSFQIYEGKNHNNSDISALINGLNPLK